MSKLYQHTDQGVRMFDCPGCQMSHVVYTDDYLGSYPARWSWNGDAERPTFSPSILVLYSRWEPPASQENPNPGQQIEVEHVCHSFVTDGRIQYLSDCTHELAGKTVELPDIED